MTICVDWSCYISSESMIKRIEQTLTIVASVIVQTHFLKKTEISFILMWMGRKLSEYVQSS